MTGGWGLAALALRGIPFTLGDFAERAERDDGKHPEMINHTRRDYLPFDAVLAIVRIALVGERDAGKTQSACRGMS